MNVALVTHSVVKGDGQGRVNYELTRHLLREGVDVHLIADDVAPELLAAGAHWKPVHPYPLAGTSDLIKVWRFRQMASRVLARTSHSYDLIVACGVVLSQPHAFNVVHFVHGTWLRSPFHASNVTRGPEGWYQWLYSALNARWERQVFAQAGRVVAVSEMVRQELIAVGVPPGKLEVVVNGVDLDEFAPGAADRKALRLPEDEVLGLFVGDIRSSIKNLDTVLHALVEAPSVHLAVAGALKGSPYPALANKLGVADRVHFLGFRDDVAALMKAADFFVLPSRRDSCPLVLLEAMASALPVITARTVGTSNLVGAECGFVLEHPQDTETLAEGLRALAADPALRRDMGRAARGEAEHHSWQKMAEQYLCLFKEHQQASAGSPKKRLAGAA